MYIVFTVIIMTTTSFIRWSLIMLILTLYFSSLWSLMYRWSISISVNCCLWMRQIHFSGWKLRVSLAYKLILRIFHIIFLNWNDLSIIICNNSWWLIVICSRKYIFCCQIHCFFVISISYWILFTIAIFLNWNLVIITTSIVIIIIILVNVNLTAILSILRN